MFPTDIPPQSTQRIPSQDWVTPSIKNMGTPRDFNGDQLNIHDEVLFSLGNELPVGLVAELLMFGVVEKSKLVNGQRVTISPESCIKFASE